LRGWPASQHASLPELQPYWCFRAGPAAQDLWRCQARYADALFILCNKYSASPAEEDTRNIMTLLALGQALQVRVGAARRCALHPASLARRAAAGNQAR
jgi:hypothetical protein